MTATEIREALSERTMPLMDRYDVFREAARAYADLLENGRKIWWCENHANTGTDDRCWKALMMGFQHAYALRVHGEEATPEFPDCSMVALVVGGES